MKLHWQLPNVIAIPIEQYLESVRASRKYHRSRCPPSKLDFPSNPAIIMAVDSLRSVIVLTCHLISDGPPSHVDPIMESLDVLEETLGVLEYGLRHDCPDGIVTIDTSGVSDLTEHMKLVDEIEMQMGAEDDQPQLSHLVRFWLIEIERRVSEIFNICILSVDTIRTEANFTAVSNLHFFDHGG